MASSCIVPSLPPVGRIWQALTPRHSPYPQADLHTLDRHPDRLPRFVRESTLAMAYLKFFGPLAWEQCPERDLQRNWGQQTIPLRAFAAACLVKIDQQIRTFARLRRYLVDHPALLWLLGFPLTPSRSYPWGFDAEASLPTHRHLTRMLHATGNDALQSLLTSSVALLQAELQGIAVLGESVSLDTKHILAWVKENNPKAYVSDRFDKERQPAGDPDCRLGCKRRHNQATAKRPSSDAPPPTPTKNPIPGAAIDVGEFYWGYASGVVATKVPDWGEFVLAEWTQPFDRPDVSYFQPLLADTARRLGHPPRYGAFDAAFDAFYVYEYFDQAGGFAAVPMADRGGRARRSFDAQGLPLCEAGLPMPLKYTYQCRTALVPHECARYVCPLLFPQPNGEACPIGHKNWPQKGCATTMATSIGARRRYQIDRQSEAYKEIYKQRTATERVNSQAVELGIERPHLRNGAAIANLNTLIYVLINLHALQRIRLKKAAS
jgi:hypothetical protein